MPKSEEISLNDLIGVLWKWRRHLVFSFILIFSAVFLIQSLPQRGKKVFKATSVVRISHESNLPLMLANSDFVFRPVKINVAHEANTIKSDANLREALSILNWPEDKLDKLAGMISVSHSERDNTISITAYSDDPVEAKEVADALAKAYVKMSKQRFEEIVDKSIEYLRESAEDVSERLRSSYRALALLVQQTGVVDPKSQLEMEVKRIREIKEQLQAVESKISAIEALLADISQNTEITEIGNESLSTTFLKNGLPKGVEAVEMIKNRIDDLLQIDESLAEFYSKYAELEEKRQEIMKVASSEHPKVKEVEAEMTRLFFSALNNIKMNLTRLKLKRDKLKEQMESSLKEIRNMTGYISDYMYLGNNIDIMNTFFENYYVSFIQMKIATGLWSSYAEIYKFAETPSVPISRTRMNILISFLVAITGSIVLAFLLENLDVKFRTADEMREETGIYIGGVITRVPRFEIGSTDLDVFLYEDLRKLKVSLQIHKNRFSAIVMSPFSGDGKSSLIWGLGKVFSDYGYKVAILDLNFRHPEVSEKFSVSEGKCISNVLIGSKAIDEVEIKINDNISLFGVYKENTLWNSDIFISANFRAFLVSLKDRFDFVFVDTSPVFVVPDSISMIKNFDLVLAVSSFHSSTKKVFKKFINILKDAGAKNIVGVVNMVPRDYADVYAYYSQKATRKKKYYNRKYAKSSESGSETAKL